MEIGKAAKVIVTVLIVLVVLALAACLALGYYVTHGTRYTLEEAWAWQSERYDTSFYQALDKTKYTVQSYDGYELTVELLKNPEPTSKYVIFSHGNSDNRLGSLKYVEIYLNLGYNCIIYDMRGHGEDEPTYNTFGIREGHDLAELVADTHERYPELSELGLHGESLGAATSIAALAYDPDVDFVVSDCAFEEIETVLREKLASMHVPDFIVDFADFGVRILYRYSLKDARPIDALPESDVAVLYIHGAADDLIFPHNSQDLFDQTKGKRSIYFAEGAGHAESIFCDAGGYREVVAEFLGL